MQWRPRLIAPVLCLAWMPRCEATPDTGDSSGACQVSPGDLLIVEIMARPNVPPEGSSRPRVEWFEVFNASLEPRSLAGMVFEAGTTTRPKTQRVPASMAPTLQPGDFLVVGNGFLGDGVTGHAWPEMVLADDGATITLRCGDRVVDQVTYGDDVPGPGKARIGQSWQLSSRVFQAGMAPDPTVNEVPEQWCLSGPGEKYDDEGNQGTPGSPNRACVLPGECRDGAEYRPIRAPEPGDLVLTEWFANPAGTDGSREWFEFLARRDLDLNGVVVDHLVTTNSRTVTLQGEVCLATSAGQYVVVAESTVPTENGGITGLPWSPGAFDLYNDAVTVTWKTGEGTVLGMARVPRSREGVSQSLDPGSLDRSDPEQQDWCASGTSGYFEGMGTPGLPNEDCP
ncbi:MAG TPA: lamin tail domain-containing protein [Myxococcota bacterium]|nr:lamin tail domain-containing protein [Myxococcota bacterium]HQK51101.1 lamin tail domain-containing protein [Myxococcota bacterium]